MPLAAPCKSAEDIAAADDDADLGAGGDRVGDIPGQPVDHGHVDAVAAAAHQRFAG